MAAVTTGPLFIGIDIGTSSVKALLGGPGGQRLDAVSRAHATARPDPGAAEQDPAAWLTAVQAALTRFAQHPRAGDVAAIGITSQVNTHVPCDAQLTPTHAALTWQDTRPSAQAELLDAQLDTDAKTAALGAPIPIDASHALARLAWFAETQPDIDVTHLLLPKDFIIGQLTGTVAADPMSSVGLVGPDLTYAEAVLGVLPRSTAVLPPLVDPLDIVGPIRPGLPFAGLPVAAGTMDAWASLFGLGVISEGEAMYLSGTSEVLGLISQHRAGARGIITFPDWRGITLHAGPTQSGGASLAWLGRLLGQDLGSLDRLAQTARIQPESPLFLPHLDGERAPLWDPHSRAAFAGLSSASGAADLTVAVMEGVAFSARLALEAIEISAGRPAPYLRHGGGGARSDAWCQVRATALGRPLHRVATQEPGALGALILAATAAGTLPNLAEATRALVAHDRDFAPDPGETALAEARFGTFKDLYAGLTPINATLTSKP